MAAYGRSGKPLPRLREPTSPIRFPAGVDRRSVPVDSLGRMRAAFADESFFEHPTAGFYVLAAVVFDAAVAESAREAMLQLRGRRQTAKLHWNEMSTPQRLTAAKTLADLDGLHVVTVGAPVPAKRQERARAQCLTRLVVELAGYGVTDLVMEARTAALDRRDVTTVTGARHHLPRGTRFRVEHRPGGADALFWAADIVAGAVRAGRSGQGEHRRLLDDRIYEITVATDC